MRKLNAREAAEIRGGVTGDPMLARPTYGVTISITTPGGSNFIEKDIVPEGGPQLALPPRLIVVQAGLTIEK